MPRRHLRYAGGLVVHVVNRGVRRERLFFGAPDYTAFVKVLSEALVEIPTRLLAFCVMPNHWHLVIWVSGDELPRFMHWLTMTHAKRWHKVHGSTGSGPLYQNRYYAAPVQHDHHLLNVIRYVERNALRAGLVRRAEDWPWASLWHRCNFSSQVPLSSWPLQPPDNWVDHVNEPQTRSELAAIRSAVRKGFPIGDTEWSALASQALGIVRRRPGRPTKKTPGVSFHFLPQCRK